MIWRSYRCRCSDQAQLGAVQLEALERLTKTEDEATDWLFRYIETPDDDVTAELNTVRHGVVTNSKVKAIHSRHSRAQHMTADCFRELEHRTWSTPQYLYIISFTSQQRHGLSSHIRNVCIVILVNISTRKKNLLMDCLTPKGQYVPTAGRETGSGG